jgi:hypothetical protein
MDESKGKKVKIWESCNDLGKVLEQMASTPKGLVMLQLELPIIIYKAQSHLIRN